MWFQSYRDLINLDHALKTWFEAKVWWFLPRLTMIPGEAVSSRLKLKWSISHAFLCINSLITKQVRATCFCECPRGIIHVSTCYVTYIISYIYHILYIYTLYHIMHVGYDMVPLPHREQKEKGLVCCAHLVITKQPRRFTKRWWHLQ